MAVAILLTTKPLTRRLSEAQKEWLYILPLVDGDAMITITVTYTDATTAATAVNLLGLRASEVVRVPMDYATRNYLALSPGDDIAKIVATIDCAQTTITYLAWAPRTDIIREFQYANSLGGFDSFICTGDRSATFKIEQDTARLPLQVPVDTSLGQYRSVNTLGSEKAVASSGYKPKKEIEAFKDLMMSNQILERITYNGREVLVPVILDKNSVKFPPEKQNLRAVDFAYKYAWDDVALNRVI